MTVLPIVARELSVASRRRSTYWIRTGAATLVMMVGTLFFLLMQYQPPAEVALTLFGILTGGAVLYSLFSGVRATADCLSEEKREGTLGLLFLTDLKGYDVVLGKLAANSLDSFYGAVAVMPILAIPLLLGGVTIGEFQRMGLVAINALFFSLTLGICVSAMSKSARRAGAATFLIILLFAGIAPIIGFWVMYSGRFRAMSSYFFMPSAWTSFYYAFDLNYKPGAKSFWQSQAVVHALGWIFLVAASLIAPRSWKERPAGVQMLRWRERWQLWSFGNLAQRRAFRSRLLDENAFFWLAGRARLKPASVWAVLGLFACGWIWGLARFHRDWLFSPVYLATGFLLNTLIKGWFAIEAGRQIAEDRRQGTLELVLSTPLTVREIIRGQALALRRQFLGPTLALLGVELFFLVASPYNVEPGDDHAGWVSLWAASMLMLVADLPALFWVGTWQSLVAKNPHRAAFATLLRIVILPWVAIGLVLFGLGIASLSPHFEFDPGWKFFLGLWFGLGLATDLAFGIWSREKLISEFRQAAAQRYAPRKAPWKRLLRRGSAPEAQPLPPVINQAPG
jgi:ABC-type Na+ efflux pump permease subunit